MIYSFFNSLLQAFNGILYFLIHERNAKLQLFIAFMVITASTYFNISYIEWLSVLFCIGITISLEIVNTSIEKICDLIQPNYHPSIKIIKDISAGAVLFFSLVSSVIGCIIFLPKIYPLL